MIWALRFFKTLIVVQNLGIALGAAITLQRGGTTKRSEKAKHRNKLKLVYRFCASNLASELLRNISTLLYVCIGAICELCIMDLRLTTED